jgi:hypothetical protein
MLGLLRDCSLGAQEPGRTASRCLNQEIRLAERGSGQLSQTPFATQYTMNLFLAQPLAFDLSW